MKLELNYHVDKDKTHFLEDRAEWDLRLLDARRCGGCLWSDVLRRKKKTEIARRKAKARKMNSIDIILKLHFHYYHIWTYNPRFYSPRKMNSIDIVLKLHFHGVWERVKGEQELLLGLFAKRNRGVECAASLRALRDHYCTSDMMSMRTLESFRAMDLDKGGTVDMDELRLALQRLPHRYGGEHEPERVIEWVTQFGTNKKSFDFAQWEKAFTPHMEVTETQQMEILKRRKYDVLSTMEQCHSLARRIFAGRSPYIRRHSLNTQHIAIGVAKWLFEARAHRLPKPPPEGGEWSFSTEDVYREYIDGICRNVQHDINL